MKTEPDNLLERKLRSLQIVVSALSMGVVVFITVLLYQRQMGQVPAPLAQGPMITYIGIPMLLGSIALQVVILPALEARVSKKPVPQSQQLQVWVAAFMLRTIVGCALIEGPAFICAVGARLDGLPWGIIAAGVGVACMLGLHFPTKGRFQAFVERLDRPAM